ncbi:MAG: serine/threonine protein phosphatase [Planctomycetales bacterium]|nr:serine/threonine protein phosphatase [Planctomycetales bacterium]
MPPIQAKRTIAIGDIHGCSRALDALLDWIEPTADDCVVALGDYVDKGPDTAGAIERLIQLGGQCQLVSLLGNHDQLMLDAIAGRADLAAWVNDQGGRATLSSYAARFGGDFPASALSPEQAAALVPSAHQEFLRNCTLRFESHTHFFVHASYDARLPLDAQPRELLLDRSLRDFVPARHRSGKTAVVGHTSQKNGQVLDLGYLICLDTNCAKGGWLTAREFPSGRTWQVDIDGRRRG